MSEKSKEELLQENAGLRVQIDGRDAEIARLRENLAVAKSDEANAAYWAGKEEAQCALWDCQKERNELRAQLAAQQAAVQGEYCNTPLYAAPAAPQQGVVMPEKMAYDSDWEAGYNAAIDEFSRLNADRSAQGEKP